jgi:hypothetical protein
MVAMEINQILALIGDLEIEIREQQKRFIDVQHKLPKPLEAMLNDGDYEGFSRVKLHILRAYKAYLEEVNPNGA